MSYHSPNTRRTNLNSRVNIRFPTSIPHSWSHKIRIEHSKSDLISNKFLRDWHNINLSIIEEP